MPPVVELPLSLVRSRYSSFFLVLLCLVRSAVWLLLTALSSHARKSQSVLRFLSQFPSLARGLSGCQARYSARVLVLQAVVAFLACGCATAPGRSWSASAAVGVWRSRAAVLRWCTPPSRTSPRSSVVPAARPRFFSPPPPAAGRGELLLEVIPKSVRKSGLRRTRNEREIPK